MADRYAKLKAELHDNANLTDRWYLTVEIGTIRALLADYDEAERALILTGKVNKDLMDTVLALKTERDKLREALWVVAEHNALHFGESHNTVIVGRAALAQEQGESDDNQA